MTYLIKTANPQTKEYNYSVTKELPSNLEYSKVKEFSSEKEAYDAILSEKVFNLLYGPVCATLLLIKAPAVFLKYVRNQFK
jgi:hypothetical protein